MADELPVPAPPTLQLPVDVAPLSDEEVEQLARLVGDAQAAYDAARAPRTLEEYRKGWLHFCAWVRDHVPGAPPVGPPTPPGLVALFLPGVRTAEGDTPSLSILNVWRCAIDFYNLQGGHEAPSRHPQVRGIWEGVRRQHASLPRTEQVVALTPQEMQTLVMATAPGSAAGRRDRALLLVGWVGALRREELVDLTWGRIGYGQDREGHQAMLLDLGATKGDQEGQAPPHPLPVTPSSPLDPRAALDAWAGDVRHADGGLHRERAVFRAVNRWGKVSAQGLDPASVSRILNRIAGRAGVDRGRLTAHSLRAGGITAASDAGTFKMKELARHKRLDTTAHYYRPADEYRGLPLREVLEKARDGA